MGIKKTLSIYNVGYYCKGSIFNKNLKNYGTQKVFINHTYKIQNRLKQAQIDFQLYPLN